MHGSCVRFSSVSGPHLVAQPTTASSLPPTHLLHPLVAFVPPSHAPPRSLRSCHTHTHHSNTREHTPEASHTHYCTPTQHLKLHTRKPANAHSVLIYPPQDTRTRARTPSQTQSADRVRAWRADASALAAHPSVHPHPPLSRMRLITGGAGPIHSGAPHGAACTQTDVSC